MFIILSITRATHEREEAIETMFPLKLALDKNLNFLHAGNL